MIACPVCAIVAASPRQDAVEKLPVSAAGLAEITGDGLPDGMAIDEEDGLWVALWGGGAVHRYDAAGRLDLVVNLPVTNVTACAFGGPERRTLFLTTSRQDIDLTLRLRDVGETCGIAVLDHLVVGADGYVSLAERGWR